MSIITSKQDASQVLRLAFDDATQAIRTTASALAEQTVVQPDGDLLHATIDASALPTGAATSAKQDTGNTSLGSIDTKLSSQATAVKQDTGNASLASIDTKLTSPLAVTGPVTDAELRATPVPVSGTVAVSNPGLTDAQLRASAVPVSGPLTDTELRASAVSISVASLPLPSGAATQTTLAALAAKTASSAVTEAFDEQVIAYVGATTDVDTVTYKLGGVTVAVTTFSYDGSNRLTGVVTT